MIGKMVLRFRITEWLGQRGRPEAFLAQDTSLGCKTARRLTPSAMDQRETIFTTFSGHNRRAQ